MKISTIASRQATHLLTLGALILVALGAILTPAAFRVSAQGGDQNGSHFTGRIDDAEPFFNVPLTISQADSTITADIIPQDEKSGLDTVLYLVDGDGNILAENDDRARGISSSLLIYPHTDPGDYVLVATRYKGAEGDSAGDFALTLTVEPGTADMPAYDISDAALAANGFPTIDTRPPAEWVILAYYGGDTNLEPGIMNDFNEMELAGGSSDAVRVVTLMDRTPGYSDASGDWKTAQLFEVGGDVSGDEATVYPPTLDTLPLADLGEKNMGDGAVLAQFLAWGIRHYPAQHYAIAFGSHGGGWPGLITDDTNNHDILSIPELRAAFALATAEAGVERFDVLINDACLMSSAEYFAAIADYFRLSYASPEIVADPALDMTLFITLLENGTDPAQVGTELVNTYINRDIGPERSDSAYLTNAVTDLTAFPAVTHAVEAFATLVEADPAQYAMWLGEARSNTYTYTAFLGVYELIDLGSFMQQVIAVSDDEVPAAAPLDSAAQAVLDALDAARLYALGGDKVAARSTYYNIYFPDRSKDFHISYLEQSPLVNWGIMLRSYYNAMTPSTAMLGTRFQTDAGMGVEPDTGPDEGGPAPDAGTKLVFHGPRVPEVNLSSVYPPVASTLTQVNIQMEIVGRNLASGTFTADRVLPDGSLQRLNVSPIYTQIIDEDGYPLWVNQWEAGVDIGDFIWDVRLPVISDGVVAANELIVDSDEISSLAGRYREPGASMWQDVSVVFNDAGYLQRVVAEAAGSDALGVVRIPEGSEFQAFREIVTPDGRTVREPGTLYTWPPGGVELTWEPAPSGTYNVGIEVTTFGGTTGFDSVQVQVNNDGVDPQLSGYTEMNFGVTYTYDAAEWGEPAYYDGDYFVYQTTWDEVNELALLALDTPATDPEEILDEFLYQYSDWFEYAGDIYIEPTQVGGLDVLGFVFEYVDDYDDLISVQGFAVYHAELELPLIFFVTGDDDIAYSAFERLLTDTTFFAVEDTRQWTFDTYSEFESYPIPNAWFDNFTEDDFGLWYWPTADSSGPTFAAVAAFEPDPTLDGLALHRELFEAFANHNDMTPSDPREYRSEYMVWTVTTYDATIDGEPVIGRFYTSGTPDAVFALWFQAPAADAPDLYRSIFEIVADGFKEEVPYE